MPEAQRDRFLFLVTVDYPNLDQEREIVERTTSEFEAEIEPVIDGATILECQKSIRRVPVPDHAMEFALKLVRSARPKSDDSHAFVKELIDWGPGPRACQQIVLASKVRALLHGRYHVTVDDIRTLAHPVLRHRIVPTFRAEAEGIDVDELIQRLLDAVTQEA